MPASKGKRNLPKQKIVGAGQGRVSLSLNQRARAIRGKIIVNLGPAKTGQKKGGRKMPVPRKPVKQRKKPTVPQFNIPGQKAQFNVHGSKYKINRDKDEFQIQAPKKPRVKFV